MVAFADASLVAQAAVVYGVQVQEEGTRISRLLCSRTKVSPLRKQETVARLELQAALMAVELMREVGMAFKIDLNEPLFFTDSTTVLWWLRSTKALPVFVANRITKILDGSDISQWKHVRTHENPADLPTRGVVPGCLIDQELWWNGPSFLLTDKQEWPEQPEIKETAAALSEVRRLESHLERLHLHVEVKPVLSPFQKTLLDRLGRFSSLRRGIRAFANVRCFLRKRKGLPHDEGMRTLLEQELLEQVVRLDQLQTFTEVIHALNLGEKVRFVEPGASPWMDDKGLLRVAGRLRFLARLPPQMRSPIVLAADSPLALEILRDLHQHDLRHTGGVRGLVGASRQLWWIVSASKLAKRILRNCAWCKRKDLKIVGADAAPLNWTRIGETHDFRAFQHVGIDMAGPFETKAGPGKPRHKRWLIIFSCCVTRAVNVEMVYDASGKSCSMALERHCSVYGLPLTISSDNGGNLVRTRKQVEEIWRVWSDNSSFWEQRFPQIRWWLNPPYTPRWGGHFEIAVKAVKNAMEKVVQWPHVLLNDEELQTLVKEVGLLLNLRPLVEPSPDLHDGPPLRPCDFLLTGNPIMGLPPVEERYYSFRERRDELDKALVEVRKGFQEEYLTGLNRVRRNVKNSTRVEIGDIVYVTNPPVSGRDLPLGYVRSLRRGIDQEVKKGFSSKQKCWVVLNMKSAGLALLEILQKAMTRSAREKPVDFLGHEVRKSLLGIYPYDSASFLSWREMLIKESEPRIKVEPVSPREELRERRERNASQRRDDAAMASYQEKRQESRNSTAERRGLPGRNSRVALSEAPAALAYDPSAPPSNIRSRLGPRIPSGGSEARKERMPETVTDMVRRMEGEGRSGNDNDGKPPPRHGRVIRQQRKEESMAGPRDGVAEATLQRRNRRTLKRFFSAITSERTAVHPQTSSTKPYAVPQMWTEESRSRPVLGGVMEAG